MPEFIWHAADAAGKTQDGRLNVASVQQAMKQLRERGLIPLRIEDAASGGTQLPASADAVFGPARRRSRPLTGPVRQSDVLAMTAELSIMLKAGLALDNALRVLIDMSAKPSVAELQRQILNDVKGGAPLSRALGKHQKLFGDFYINMVRSGEASGQIAAVMERLSEHMERLRALRESAISATMYPAILLVVAVLSLVAMLGFVVPQFQKLFTDMGDALPLPTRIVMGLGKAFTDYGLVLGLLAVGGGWLLVRWLRSPAGRQSWQTRALGVPVLGPLILKYDLTLYARSLGTLLGNGVPMLMALHIATETVGNVVLRQALFRVTPIVKDGGRVVDAMVSTHIFEPLAISLMRVGEETGRMGPMMLELAAILDREVETGIKRALTLVEPVLILVLGILIASIIVSILMGILSVNDLAV